MHFFGQIVIYNDTATKKKYIIDGQQRTVTSMLFLRAMQYYCETLRGNPLTDAQKTELDNIDYSIKQCLGRPSTQYDSDVQLHLNFENEIAINDYFQNKIIKGAPTSKKETDEPARENMRAAYYYFYDKLQEKLKSAAIDEQIKMLYPYRNSLLDRFEVMYLETNDLGESYVIFETLNARGQELETSDLLKNYVFSKSGGNLPSVEDKWKKVTNTLAGLDLTKYIRYYWNARYGLVREKDLYREISATIKSPKDAIDLVTDLNTCAPYFHDIFNPDNCIAFDDKETIQHLFSLQSLKATTFVPIVLALEMRKDQFTAGDIANILDAIETYIFRNATIAGKTANATEVFFSSIANDIYEQNFQSEKEITDTIRGKMIADEDFENLFVTFSTKTTQYIRYILLKVHDHLNSNHELNRNPSDVNIEHIMPQTLSPAWNIDSKIHERYVQRLGNLALLDEKLNKKASNAPFVDKKEYYKKSLIKPNQNLLQYNQWTPAEIEDRQKNLAKLALEIWR